MRRLSLLLLLCYSLADMAGAAGRDSGGMEEESGEEANSALEDTLSCGLCGFIQGGEAHLCTEGDHIVCSGCKGAANGKCPNQAGACGVIKRSTTIERAIAASGIPVHCRHRADGCEFRGIAEEWESHVDNCGFRRVKCPVPVCKEHMLASNVLGHLQKLHERGIPSELTAEPISWCLDKFRPADTVNPSVWWGRCFTAEGQDFIAIFTKGNGTYHTWVVGLFGAKIAKDFKAAIKVGKVTNGVNWESKVFPVDTGSDEIRADPFCLELPFRHVEHMARQDEDGNLCIDIGYSVDKV